MYFIHDSNAFKELAFYPLFLDNDGKEV